MCRSLGLDLSGQTSASYNMRLNYERCLLDFENYLGSGQYAGDLAAGAAPHFASVTEPQRNFGHLPPPDMGLEGEGGGAVAAQTVRCAAVSRYLRPACVGSRRQAITCSETAKVAIAQLDDRTRALISMAMLAPNAHWSCHSCGAGTYDCVSPCA